MSLVYIWNYWINVFGVWFRLKLFRCPNVSEGGTVGLSSLASKMHHFAFFLLVIFEKKLLFYIENPKDYFICDVYLYFREIYRDLIIILQNWHFYFIIGVVYLYCGLHWLLKPHTQNAFTFCLFLYF